MCENGSCENDLFFEDFEDGDADGWTFLGGGYSMFVTSGTAASGSAYSLTMTGGNTNHYDGIYRTFSPGIVPERFGYFARHESTVHGTYLTLHDTAGAPALSSEVAFVYFRALGLRPWRAVRSLRRPCAVPAPSQSAVAAAYSSGVTASPWR
jgi:hypothetical protein